MFQAAIERFNRIVGNHGWATELAGILPLSALIDFVAVPAKLHGLELTGTTPLWTWLITPSGSRLLLSGQVKQKTCCLDRYGSSTALLGLDGRSGDQYVLANPETLRLCISSQAPRTIRNDHYNMFSKDLRVQNLEILHISRTNEIAGFRLWTFLISATGWILLAVLIIMSGILRCYLSLAFLLVIPVTGAVVTCLYGITPRRLLVKKASGYNRLIIVAEHMNAIDWKIFYGESTVLNSLLNRPLEPEGPEISDIASTFLLMALRALILGQWAIVVGAASVKDWNAYFISFWIIITVLFHAYVITPRGLTSSWMKTSAHIRMNRFQTQLSSRRALLNTLIALNPDTFSWDENKQEEKRDQFRKDSIKWLDPILAPIEERRGWETATLAAMNEALQGYTEVELQSPRWKSGKGKDLLSDAWNKSCLKKNSQHDWYWKTYILEGIYMAAKIKTATKFSGRKLAKTV